MDTSMYKRAEKELVVFIAIDSDDEFYLYKQAFMDACPRAVIYCFARKGELLDALGNGIYPAPILIIMDWNMASRKGYVALSVLGQTPAWQSIPVVIMTDQTKPVDEEKCILLGYEVIIPKEKHYPKFIKQLKGIIRAFV